MKKLKIFGTHQKVESESAVVQFLQEIIAHPPKSGKALERAKYAFSAKHGVTTIQNRDLVVTAKRQGFEIPQNLAILLQKRSVRTISGVSPIGILTKPYPCPGKCVYCPTEDRMPKSYMSNQPAAARAVRNNFHPHRQVRNRITALEESGHPTSKLEIIVMGGTWSFLPHKYQSWYLKKCYDAANGDPEVVHHPPLDKEGGRGGDLTSAQKKNETADRRIIGLTLETRPDFINERELVRMRRYGCTRIEIGVQTLDDEVQKLTKRGHKRTHVIRAMKLMKDFGFKVCFHLMPGLPGSTPEKDLEWLREVFENPDFRPDFIKIYPCVVLETAELKQWWKEGRYEPYDDETLVKLLLQFKTFVPPWTRIMRLMRDIPVSNILGGAKLSNLRQILKDQPQKLREVVGDEFYQDYLKRHPEFLAHKRNASNKELMINDGWPCQCIRCREIGFKDVANFENLKGGVQGFTPILKRRDYDASGSTEVFLSFESEDEAHLFALLRLRKPSGQKFSHFKSVFQDAALIREVHSYGSEVSVGDEAGVGQHRGLGKALIQEAERIAKEEWGLKRMTIIAGVGTREYYRKWGYRLQSTYMTKKL